MRWCGGSWLAGLLPCCGAETQTAGLARPETREAELRPGRRNRNATPGPDHAHGTANAERSTEPANTEYDVPYGAAYARTALT